MYFKSRICIFAQLFIFCCFFCLFFYAFFFWWKGQVIVQKCPMMQNMCCCTTWPWERCWPPAPPNHLLGVECQQEHVATAADLESRGRLLLHHFRTHGTPVMVGGGAYAYTILGAQYHPGTGQLSLLILARGMTQGHVHVPCCIFCMYLHLKMR